MEKVILTQEHGELIIDPITDMDYASLLTLLSGAYVVACKEIDISLEHAIEGIKISWNVKEVEQ